MNASARTLVLMRHASRATPTGSPTTADPLAARGQREAGLAGTWIRDHLAPIERVLCSSAARTADARTRRHRRAGGLPGPPLRRHPGSLISEVNAVDDAVRTCWSWATNRP